MNDTKITLTDLTVEEVNMILVGLAKLPLEASLNVWTKIRQQGEQQITPIDSSTKPE